MGGFLKKLFKDDMENMSREDEAEALRIILAEENISGGRGPVETNRLPEVSNEIATEVFNDFSCYQFYSCSDRGMVKESNQDSLFTGAFKFNVANRELSAGMAIVADGMGGLSMGEAASSTAVASVSTYMYARLSEYIRDGLPHNQVVLGHISGAVQNANMIVNNLGKELGEEMGTTFTCVFLLGNTAYFGNVGDSRAYLIDTENRLMEKVTRDHSLVGQLVEMGKLTEAEAKSHPRRNEIYRMLGLRYGIEVDTYFRTINKNSIIVLMSDGLWEFVDDKDLLDEILNGDDYSISVKKLVDMANKNGGHDNISFVIVKPIK